MGILPLRYRQPLEQGFRSTALKGEGEAQVVGIPSTHKARKERLPPELQ